MIRKALFVVIGSVLLSGCIAGDLSGPGEDEESSEHAAVSIDQTCAAQCEIWALCSFVGWAGDHGACIDACLEGFAIVEADEPACYDLFVDFMVCLAGYTTCEEWTDYVDGDAEFDAYLCSPEESAYQDCF